MTTSLLLDDAPFSQQLARLKLAAEFANLQKECDTLPPQGSIAASLRRLAIGKRIREIIIALGLSATPAPASSAAPVQAPAIPGTVRASTAHLYAFDPQRKLAQRKQENAAALALLAQIDAGTVDADDLTQEQKGVLAKYSGTGGGLIGADGKKGSAYEYYTPAPIAQGAWDLLREMGFSGGKVLDPCAGGGVFGATAPVNAVVDAVELNPTSGRINALVNQGAGYSVTIAPFEKVAAHTRDETYDAVVANVPFGALADRGGNQLLDGRYQKEPLQNYFILRSLEKLRPGGLAAFIAPPRCISGRGGKEEELRIAASYMAEFLGAYRLPNAVFGSASADTITDLLIFRKYDKPAQEKIAELREQAPQTLIEAKVQWQEFVNGHYFEGEGKRFILGEFKAKDPDKFRDVDRVINPASVAEIGKLLKKLPGSRVDWALLGQTETAPLVYAEGDSLMQAGQTLVLHNGAWVVQQGGAGDTGGAYALLLSNLSDPYTAFSERIAYLDAIACSAYLERMAREWDAPGWLRATLEQLESLPDMASMSQVWNMGVVALAVLQVIEERQQQGDVTNYLNEFPALSDAMQRFASSAKACRSVRGPLKSALATLCTHYSKKKGFSAFWRGDIQAATVPSAISAEAGFDGLCYQNKSPWVALADARKVMGEDFAPEEDANWCLSGDGQQVMRADDYYIGNYGEFLRKIDAEIATAPNEAVRAKLLRQKLEAQNRIDKVDVSNMHFNLFSPHITLEEKAEFLRRFVHPKATVIFDEKSGEQRLDIDISGSNLTDTDKIYKRFGEYLKNGSITLGGAKLKMSDEAALKTLRKMVNKANEQLNNWARSNHTIISRLQQVADQPDKLRFRQQDDEAELAIPGMSNLMKGHGYQNAFIRRQGREFGGGNGFDVGLGKTWTSLASVQHAHNIGVKQKTAFIVPSSVLSNWHKEAGRAYASLDDCLFIGLKEGKEGRADVQASQFDSDLLRVLENRHRKIFMTVEAFARIKLRDATIAKFEAYMRQVDASFAESDDKKADERAKGKQAGTLASLYDKRGAAPYLEDMGIDSLVFDEAHLHKNSAKTVDFSGAKFLSVSPASKRGIDAQAKAWYIRSNNALQDGVLCLSATPITNSPLEIYAMLSLAVGHERVNDLCVGIRGADHFMNMMCQIENQDDMTIDGIYRTTDVFIGLRNAPLLRNAVNAVYTIKNAHDVGAQIVVPGREEVETTITLPEETLDRLTEYKDAFRFAVDLRSRKKEMRGSEVAFEAVAKRFGLNTALVAHPFNLINTMALEIADPELGERTMCYLTQAQQRALAEKVVAAFNAKAYREERPRPGPRTQKEAIVLEKITKDKVSGQEIKVLTIEVRALLEDNGKVVIDSMDPALQDVFEKMAADEGLELDVTIPPKLAAMLDNFQKEQAQPRGKLEDGSVSPIVKQIIFCDILPLHNKIKLLLIKRAAVPPASIAIITGKINNSADDILEVQNGFNAHGVENQYRVVIANEKAEVGINLQQGTQAIHHLTIGWTPDSLRQRNGRGVRQGNHTAAVRIYQYDADGSFDCSKRTLVEKKADWIDEVMGNQGHGDGGDFVAVSGGLSHEQLQVLIESVGDGEAMRRMQATLDAKEAQARASSNRERQLINLDSIQKQVAWIKDNHNARTMGRQKILQLWKLHTLAETLRTRIGNAQASASAIAKNEALLADTNTKLAGVRREIETSIVLRSNSGGYQNLTSLDEFLKTTQGKFKDSDVLSMLEGHAWPKYDVFVNPGSDLQREWEAEVGMARAMIDQCQASYLEQAKAEGAYPAPVVQAIAEGRGRVGVGMVLVDNCFFRLKDERLGLLNFEKFIVIVANSQARLADQTVASCLREGTAGDNLIYPGSADYDACLSAAAEIEDNINARGEVENGFSERLPEVAKRRKTSMLCRYAVEQYILPHPHFPFVIEPDQAHTAITKRIVDEQKAVVKAVLDGHTRHFTVEATLAVESVAAQSHIIRQQRRFEALCAYALAHQIKMVQQDLPESGYLQYAIAQALTVEQLEAGLTAKNDEELTQQAHTLVTQAVPWFDFEESDPLTYHFLGYHLHFAIKNARKRLAQEAVTQAALPTDVVGISGATYPWRRTIKHIAGPGGYVFDEIARVWNVRRATWDQLQQQYPQATTSALVLCAATRSLPEKED